MKVIIELNELGQSGLLGFGLQYKKVYEKPSDSKNIFQRISF